MVDARDVFLGIAQDQSVAEFVEATFNAVHHFGIKRVIAGGNHHADSVCLVELQAARQSGGRVV